MKIISFVSLKGGAGKSTALMAVASALIARGHRLALFEADENKPLKGWRRNGIETGAWDDDLCRVLVCDSFPAMQTAFETAGGGSDLNAAIVSNSDLVILPTSLNVIDLDEAINTLELIGESIVPQAQKPIDARILLTRFPQSDLRALELMPKLTRHLRTRSAFADLKATGLLHLNLAQLSEDPKYRMTSGHVRMALAEADELAQEILQEVA